MRRLKPKQLNPMNPRMLVLLVTLFVVLVAALMLQFVNPFKVATNTLTQTPSPDTKVHAGPEHDAPSVSTTPASTTTPVSSLAKPVGPNNNTSTIDLFGPTTMMESTCRSIVGATCYIKAAKGSQTIRVSETKTVSGLSDGVILDWDAKQLDAGTWSIYAVTSKDGHEAESDPQDLVVKQ